MDSFERMREKESLISFSDISKFLSYDHKTGLMKWLDVTSNRVSTGDAAGSIVQKNNGRKQYMVIGFRGLNLQYHRVAWLLFYGSWPIDQVDHEDGNGLNNRIKNLRNVTRLQQQQNMRIKSTNTSGVTGVTFSKSRSKWVAYIQVSGKRIHIGSFIRFEDARKARKAAEVKYGFHPNHGRKQ